MGTPIPIGSDRDEWSTPDSFFAEVVAEFGEFDLDACATAANAKAKNFYTRDDDGLSKPWRGLVWCNPPYGKELPKWVYKAFVESTSGNARVVMLVPARTDTRWWHNYASVADKRLIPGRLRFGGSKVNAPFPSALLVFDNANSLGRALPCAACGAMTARRSTNYALPMCSCYGLPFYAKDRAVGWLISEWNTMQERTLGAALIARGVRTVAQIDAIEKSIDAVLDACEHEGDELIQDARTKLHDSWYDHHGGTK